jgi:Kef-type K+ transport system membrane component KefB
MGPAGLGLFSDLNDMESIADFGVLFLLFEQGLELTVGEDDELRHIYIMYK